MLSATRRSFSELFGAPPAELVAEWKAHFSRSGMRLRTGTDPNAYANIVETLLDGVYIAAQIPPGTGALLPGALLQWAPPGSADMRELEQAAAICGAALAAEGTSGFDVGAVVFGVRDVVAARLTGGSGAGLTTLFEWVSVVALDAFGQATAMAAIERAAQDLEEGTPVFSVTGELAALIWLGSPDSAAAEGIIGRLLLHLVRTGARGVVVDVTRLADPAAPGVVAAMQMLFSHRKVRGSVAVVVVESDPTHSGRYALAARQVEAEVHIVDRFEEGIALAGKVVGSMGSGPR